MTRSAERARSADPARGRRGQMGGLVGAGLDTLAVARFVRALGPGAAVLGSEGGFAADFDACRHEDTPVDAGRLERLARDGRLGEIEGAFAIAWTDRGATHVVRDAVGERSVYWARVGRGIAFASTLRPLLDGGLVPRALNANALPAYLTFGYVPGPETLAAGVFQLPPGGHLRFEWGLVHEERLWSLPAEEPDDGDDEVLRRRLRARLERAVSARLPETGPLAATLSGGIDSSLVAALASRLSGSTVSTFSLSFGKGIPNELEFAVAVAARCGTDHHVVELTPRGVMDGFDATLAALSSPIGEPLTVANSVLFAAAAGYAGVVLNGEGGDPCFGGPKNVPMLISDLYGPPAHQPSPRHLERSYLLAHRKCYADLGRMLDADVLATAGLEEAMSPSLSDPRWTTLVNRLMALNVTSKGAHHILPKVDQLSRPYGVLPRSPLFDRGVVEAALRLRADLKQRGSEEKVILKRAVEDLLPPEVVCRPKSGMRVPVEVWLQGRFDRFARERLLDGLMPHGVIRRSYLEELARPDREIRPRRRGVKIWLLLSLEAWLRTVLAPRGEGP